MEFPYNAFENPTFWRIYSVYSPSTWGMEDNRKRGNRMTWKWVKVCKVGGDDKRWIKKKKREGEKSEQGDENGRKR